MITKQDAEQLLVGRATPLYVYKRSIFKSQADKLKQITMPFGATYRFAMKANPNLEVLGYIKELGLHIDASSSYEAEKAMSVGYAANHIRLTSQQLPHDWSLIKQGVLFTACSLNQFEQFAERFPGTSCGVRINPGIGSGHSAKATVGGPDSSFGIWHEKIDQTLELSKTHNIIIDTVHTHIGSGTDPDVWQEVAKQSIELLTTFTDASTLSLGGGFKVARMPYEKSADMKIILELIARELQDFYDKTGREITLELEPGTFLSANAGTLLSHVIDIVDTGNEGHEFIKLDTGMNDIMRPTLYGAQHPIRVLNNTNKTQNYVVVGHNCETGDVLTPVAGNPEIVCPRMLNQAHIGDIVAIDAVGAYCASMSVKGYNSFPSATEILIE